MGKHTRLPRSTRARWCRTGAQALLASGPTREHPGRDAIEGKGPQRRLHRRLEEVAKAVGGGYCRLQMPFELAPAVRGTVAGRRLGALEGGTPHPPSNASLRPRLNVQSVAHPFYWLASSKGGTPQGAPQAPGRRRGVSPSEEVTPLPNRGIVSQATIAMNTWGCVCIEVCIALASVAELKRLSQGWGQGVNRRLVKGRMGCSSGGGLTAELRGVRRESCQPMIYRQRRMIRHKLLPVADEPAMMRTVHSRAVPPRKHQRHPPHAAARGVSWPEVGPWSRAQLSTRCLGRTAVGE